MYDPAALLTDSLPTVSTPLLDRLRDSAQPAWRDPRVLRPEFIERACAWFAGSQLNRLVGLDQFAVREATMGCNHFIDNLIMRHGVESLQIFEHDYGYYRRLQPHLRYAQLDRLFPGMPVLIALPFPGHMAPHINMREILDQASRSVCPVHIDCAWLGAARGIDFDFGHPAIASIGMSFSKGMDLWWNRVGVRFSKIKVDSDSITAYNEHEMIPVMLMSTGLHYLDSVAPDHVWNYHAKRYDEICRDLKLRPTAIVHVAQSLDRRRMYGLKALLEG